ncbi:MAG: helix-turn-helix domain-containing protein [Bacillota bacterium]
MLTIIARPNALQAARLRRGYSLRELAEISGVNFSTISKTEKGVQGRITPRVAKRICTALEASFDDFFIIAPKADAILVDDKQNGGDSNAEGQEYQTGIFRQ